MKTLLTLTKVLAAAATLTIMAPVASAQDNDYPSPEVIATLTPVYYEGHAAYWYHNHWHWRDAHGRWNHYESEPQVLHDHRYGGHAWDRHYYAGGHHR